jgi:hypothetical protein
MENALFAAKKGVSIVLAITVDLMAFYLGAIYFERLGVFCGVTAFLVTALAGTIVSSKIEDYLTLFISRAWNARVKNRNGRVVVRTSSP